MAMRNASTRILHRWSTFKTVCEVPTKILGCGKSLDDDLTGVQNLVVVLPGNPGIIDYYEDFIEALFRSLTAKYPSLEVPVWGISHGGHQMDDIDSSMFPDLIEHPELYGLEGQSRHAYEFLKQIPNHINIIGIGHSIGCKIWKEVLRKNDTVEENQQMKITSCNLLFPTIEKMKITPNGIKFTNLESWEKLIFFWVYILSHLPSFMIKLLIRLYFIGRGVSESVINSTLHLSRYEVFQKMHYMAKCEMREVTDLDDSTLKKHIGKLFFYFSDIDKWYPIEFVSDLLSRYPNLNHTICDGIEHAFVISSSQTMVDILMPNIEKQLAQ